MLIKYVKAVGCSKKDIVSDIISLITQSKFVSDLSSSCDKDKTQVIGKPPVKAIKQLTVSLESQLWLEMEHPLYAKHFTSIGFDFSDSTDDVVMLMAEQVDSKGVMSRPTPSSVKKAVRVFNGISDNTKIIEVLVSASGILVVGDNNGGVDISGVPTTAIMNPCGVFCLEQVSLASNGITVEHGISMFALGSIKHPLESTTVFSPLTGNPSGPNQLREANLGTDFAYIGGVGCEGISARETPSYSHNGLIETTFLEAYIFSGALVYAKLHGIVRPQLNSNHVRNKIRANNVEYIGMLNDPSLTVETANMEAAKCQNVKFVYAKL